MRTTVRAHEIASLLDDAPQRLRCLSLDCFDTLIWRNVHAPSDVFADFPIPGGGVETRVNAEDRARIERKQIDGRDEVTLDAIYRWLMPHAGEDMRIAAIAHELAMEACHCFAFAPTVDLIRAAKAKAIQVVIVSDTYLSEDQLRALIGIVAGDDVVAMIDRIFVSSAYGLRKSQGLFRPILSALGLRSDAVVHLGDNPAADAEAPRRLGIHGVHFEQFSRTTEQRLRLEATAAAMIDPAIRVTRPILQPHRPHISLRSDASLAATLGHDVLGPILHGFSVWLRQEADALRRRTGRPVKALFLLRDGYLPHLAYQAIGRDGGAAVAISRVTATSAGFRGVDSIRALFEEEGIDCPRTLGKQLLLTDAEIAEIGKTRDGLRRAATRPLWVGRIVARSRAFADRMIAHLRNQGGVEPGDTVMLVDLGYNGTVQNAIEPLLRDTLDVEVAGRYLLLRERTPSGFDKRGLLDVRNYETRLLNTLCRPIAVVEQLATAAEGSVIDYHAVDGAPIRKAPDIKGAQSRIRDEIQAACVDYVRQAGAAFHGLPASYDNDGLYRAAAASLARLLFLPQTEEIALLRQFEHDVNLGTSMTVKLVDSEAAEDGLRRRGLPYLSEIDRIYLPGEIQPHGLPLALSLFTVGRFGIDLRHSDFHVGGLDVPLLIASATGQTAISAIAHPTHDGYYVVTAPIGTGGLAVGVQLGAVAECVQIEEIAFYPVTSFVDISAKPAAAATPIFDAMEQIAPGLHNCAEHGLIFVPPPLTPSEEPLLLSVTFRPVIRRAAVTHTALRKAA